MSAKQSRLVRLPITEYQRKPALERCHTVDAPTSNNAVHNATGIRKISLALSERKVQYVIDHKALRHVLGGEGSFTAQVIVVLNRAYIGFEP